MSASRSHGTIEYALEALYEHQDRDWIVDAVPHVLAWIHPDETRNPQPFVFAMQFARTRDAVPEELDLARRGPRGARP